MEEEHISKQVPPAPPTIPLNISIPQPPEMDAPKQQTKRLTKIRVN